MEEFKYTELTYEDTIKMNALANAGVKSIWDFEKQEISLRDGERLEDIEKIIELGFLEEKLNSYKANITEMLNIKAKSLGFDNLYNAGLYKTDGNNPLKPMAEKIGVYAGNVWGTAISIEQKAKLGEIAMPETWEELLALLPKWED